MEGGDWMSGASILPAMAWRNIWRNGRRTLITLAGIAFGVMLAVLFTGLADRSFSDMIDLAARMGGGHVTIEHPRWLDTPSMKWTVKDSARLGRAALGLPGVEKVVVRVSGPLLLSTARNSYGAFFMALDPAVEGPSTLAVMESISGGKMLDSATGRGIVLGARLAKNLDAGLGKKVVYTLTDSHGEIVTGLARVSGIITTGAPGVDSGVCLLPLDTVRGILGYAPGEATQVAVFLDDHRRSGAIARRLSGIVGPDARPVPWNESQPDIEGFIALKVSAMTFFEIVIMILVSASIFNTLLVSVMERTREFGIMMALGTSPASLFGLVMWESLFLGLTGLVAAAAVTIGPYMWFRVKGLDMSAMTGKGGAEISGVAIDPIVNVAIFPSHLLIIALAALAATLLSGVYPAWRAGRVVPVESIRIV